MKIFSYNIKRHYLTSGQNLKSTIFPASISSSSVWSNVEMSSSYEHAAKPYLARRKRKKTILWARTVIDYATFFGSASTFLSIQSCCWRHLAGSRHHKKMLIFFFFPLNCFTLQIIFAISVDVILFNEVAGKYKQDSARNIFLRCKHIWNPPHHFLIISF